MGKIALQGVEGAYSYEAMLKVFGQMPYKCFDAFDGVFEAVSSGETSLGILPIENSSTGSITAVYDLLNQHDVHIVGETTIKITHHLMAYGYVDVEDIEIVYSHQQGYDQCQSFFKKHPNIHFIPYKNTALSAQKIADEKRKNQAAVASSLAAKQFGLEIIEEAINDQECNYTRFIIISREPKECEKANKISVQSVISHTPGSLYKMLSCFESENINMLKIESRPIKNKTWEYIFYIDFEGNVKEDRVKRVLEHMKNYSIDFKLLGNYKAGDGLL